MNPNQDLKSDLPLKGGLTLLYGASGLIALLVTGTSTAGLLYPARLYPTDLLVRTFVPNDVANLFIGVPILLGSMALAWRGHWIGLLCWPGALFFVAYNYIAYVFAVPLTWAFPIYLILATASVYALTALVAAIDGEALQQRLKGAVPEKFAGGVLVGMGLLFALRVIGVIVAALAQGGSLPETDLAVAVADFFVTPAWVIGGLLLWRRQTLGYVAGLGLLFQASMLFIALLLFFLAQPLLTKTTFATSDFVVILTMGLICFIPFVLFVRGITAKRAPL